MLGKIEGRTRRGQQRIRWLDDITDLMDKRLSISGRWWSKEKPGVLQSWGCKELGMTAQLNNWICYNIASALCSGSLAARHVWSKSPGSGIKLAPPVLEGEALTTTPPGKFQANTFQLLFQVPKMSLTTLKLPPPTPHLWKKKKKVW